MVDADTFNLKQNFPIASIAQLYADRPTKEAAIKAQQQQILLQGLDMFGKSVDSLVTRRQQMAQALAVRKALGIEDPSGEMTADQAVSVHKETSPIAIPYMDKDGQVNFFFAPRGSKGLPSQGTPPKPQQSQYADPTDGTPLNFLSGNYLRPDGTPSRGTPVLKKGDESAVEGATLLANQIPNIKPMFDAYRQSKYPRLQATPAGSLMNPSGKQAEDSLKLAAFTFGGKNLTAQEKDVVFGALFPSWTDDDASRTLKEQLLTEFMKGKIDLLQAANLLGPSGTPLQSMLAKKMGSQKQSTQKTPTQEPKQPPPSDVVHLSTAELQNLRKKLTAHKDNANKS